MRQAAALKRVGGIGRAASILVAATGVVSMMTLAATYVARDDARAFLADEIDNDDFVQAIAPFAIFSFLQLMVFVASAVLVIVWLYRIAANLRSLHRGTTWGPGWAIGGWFTPPFLYVIPFLMLREQWKASDPSLPAGGDWRSGSTNPLITAWFVVFGPIQLAVQLSQFGNDLNGIGGSERAIAEQITGNLAAPTASAIGDLVAATLFVLAARALNARHRQLTGELG